MKTTDPSAIVVPFGKYKGRTVAELIETDQQYANWVLNQNWVAERFAELHAAILTRGAAPDDSPEHNAIQVRFLDQAFALACVMAACPGMIQRRREQHVSDHLWSWEEAVTKAMEKLNYLRGSLSEAIEWAKENAASEVQALGRERRIQSRKDEISLWEQKLADALTSLDEKKAERPTLRTKVLFEHQGIDVLFQMTFADEFYYQDRRVFSRSIEIKPTMGDDFPSVMRQMQRLKSNTLVVGSYTGSGAPEPLVRQMFSSNGLTMISVRDIEAELTNARTEFSA